MTGALIHLNTATVTNRDAFSVLTWTALVVIMISGIMISGHSQLGRTSRRPTHRSVP